MVSLNLMIGLIGMVFVLAAFVLEEFWKKFSQDTLVYNCFNILGSALLIYYAYSLGAWPFLILNTVWFIAALVKLWELLEKSRARRFRY